MLIRLTYASRMMPGCEGMFSDIVAFSNRANFSTGITGVIALDGIDVVQILEGDEHRVSELFDRIVADRRHQGIVELGRFAIGRRKYQTWGMVRRRAIEVAMMSEAI